MAVSIDGAVVEPATASISVFDRGLLFGDGCFEVLRTWEGNAVELAAHLDRLHSSAAALQLRMLPRTELTAAILRTLAAAGAGEHRIRIVVTRGPGGLAADTGSLGPGRAIVIVEPLGAQPTELSAAIVDWPLAPRHGPAHKTLAYLDHVIARDLARAAGADEAIRLGADGRAVEGATSTLYAVLEGTVVTAPLTSGILPGIVRARVLAACAALAIPWRESTFELAELRGADEIFASSSLRGVVPITKLDGVPRAAGAITARIAAAVTTALRTHASSATSDRLPG